MSFAPRMLRHALAVFFCIAGTAHAATFTVTTTSDTGPGSLRQALTDAHSGDVIVFAIPDSGVQTLRPATFYPSIIGVTIDGTTQPGYTSTPVIEIDASLLPVQAHMSALTISSGAQLIGLAINRSSGWAVQSSGGAKVTFCHIGTDPTGRIARPNLGGITGGGTFENNLISGNRAYGYRHYMILDPDTYVLSNRFGTDVTGNNLLGDANNVQISIEHNDNNTTKVHVGNNVIGGAQRGVELFYAQNVYIIGNYIGTSRSGQAVPNQVGVSAYMSYGGVVKDNFIGSNYAAGVVVYAEGLRHSITNNIFRRNGGLPIDLSRSSGWGDGVTPNDADDSDTGPNNLTNYPVLSRATTADGTTTVTGSLTSIANRTFSIELYRGACATANGSEAGTRVETFQVTTNASGVATFSRQISTSLLKQGDSVSATATSAEEGTSEFSRCVSVEGRGVIAFLSSTRNAVEAQTNVELEVVRVGGALGAMSATYQTADDTAKAGNDYVAASGVLNFADGEASKRITIGIINDAVYEGNQTFRVTLSSTNPADVGTPASATVTITDDDLVPSLYVQGVSRREGDSGTTPFPFVLRLGGAAEDPIVVAYRTVSYTATDGADFIGVNSTVSFAPGEREKTVVVQVKGDTIHESTEYFEFDVNIPGSYWSAYAWGTIENDDAEPAVTVDDITVTEGNGATKATLTLKANQPISARIGYQTIPGSAVAGEDYAPVTSWVDFNNESSKTITIQVNGDTKPETTEQFFVNFTPYNNYGYTFDRPRATITINDDDAGVAPSQLQVAVGEKRSASIQVGTATNADAVFTISTNSPEVISVPSSVVLPAGSLRVSFEVRALKRGTADIDVTFPPSYGGGSASIRVNAYVAAQFTLSPADLTVFTGQSVTVRATLQPANTADVAVMLKAGAEVSVPNSFIIPAGGEAAFEVKGVKEGLLFVTATLPSEYGGAAATIAGRVAAAPTAPTVLSISPTDGSISGGTEVTLNGTLLRNDCSVTFGGVAATATTFVNAQTLRATTPSHAAGPVDVTVTCGTAVSTLRGGFAYRASSPRISAVVPISGTTAGGTAVRITGSDIVASCWPFFGDAPATGAIVRDANTITATTPQHGAGTTNVRLVCTGATSELTGAFTFNGSEDPAPQITSINPLFGAPGDVITISGLNFRPSDGVAFGDVAARVLDTMHDTQRVVVPDAPAGTVSINITRIGGAMSTSGPIFTVTESAPPRITRVTPTAAAGAEIVLEGTSFRAPYTFAIDGRVLSNVTLSPTRAVVRLPNDVAPGTYPVGVLNAAGNIASVGPSINIRATGVVIRRIVARCSPTEGGADVTIEGAGFAAGASVTFNGIAASNVTVVNATTITARVPANEARAATVTVTNSDGTSSTLTNAFRYVSPFDPAGCATTSKARGARH